MNKVFLLASLTILSSWSLVNSYSKEFIGYCAFCDQEVLDRQKFYEDDLVIALFSHRPIYPGHSLVIPKRHVERLEELTDAEATRIHQVIRKVNSATRSVFETSAYLVLQKNGVEVGQTVPHVHFHLIPRKSNDDSTLAFLWHAVLAQIKRPISPEEMRSDISRMKEQF